MTTQEIQVLIAANTDQFTRSLNDINSKLDQFGKKADSTGQQVESGLFTKLIGANVIGEIVTNALSKITMGFENLGQKIFDNGSAYSALSITTNTVARNMGIAAGTVNDLRNQLSALNVDAISSEGIIKTLALSGLTNLSTSFKTVDATTGQAVTGTKALIVAMNDLSAAGNMTSAQGMDKITQFIRLGRLQAVDGMIDITKLTGAEAAYAASLGKTTKELTNQEIEQFRVNVVMQEAMKVQGDYAATSLTSARAFQLVGVAVQNLFTKLGSLLEPIFSVIGNAILTFIGGLQKSLNNSANAIQNWATTAAGYIMGFVRIVGYLLSWLPVVGAGFQALANFSLKPISNISNGLDNTAQSADNLASKVGKAGKALAGLASFDQMNVLQKPTSTAGAGGAGTVPIDGGTGGIGGIMSGIDVSKINGIADGVVSSFQKMFKPIQDAVKPIQDFVAGLGNIKIFGIPLVEILKDLAIGIGLVAAAFGLADIAAGLFDGAMGILAGIVGVVTLPVVILIAVIGTLIGIGILLYNNNKDFKKFIDTFVTTLKDGFTLAWKNLGIAIDFVNKNIIQPFTKWFTENMIPVFNKVGDVIKFLGGIFSDIFKAIGNIISWAWNSIIHPILKAIGDVITGLVIPIFQNLLNVGGIIFRGLGKVIGDVWGFIVGTISSAINWIEVNVIGTFNRIINNPVFNGLKATITGIWTGILAGFKQGINLIIDIANNFIGKVNGIIKGISDIATSIPGGSAINFRIGNIPHLARGGIVDSPTIAQIGESGKEAVIPLENNTQWIDLLAQKINGNGSKGGRSQQPFNLIVQVGDTKIYEGFIDWHNEKTMATNTKLLNI